METIISPQLVNTLISTVLPLLLQAIVRSVQRRGASGRCAARTNVTVSVNHGLAGADVVVRVSSDLNKSSRDLCS